ncbi:hydroxyisourate hydrolase [soil metagenome]
MADQQPTISTHVLDVGHGLPAAGVSVALYAVEGSGERLVGGGTTDEDGRIRRLLVGPLVAGDYRLEFALEGDFFRQLAVRFHVADIGRSYHVPLIMAPYSLATYRGS